MSEYIHKIPAKKSLGYAEFIFESEGDKKMSVLDLGSANSLFAQLYFDKIKIYHAFDYNKEAVLAGKNFLKRECDFKWIIESTDLKKRFVEKNKEKLLEKYDIIVFNRVFNHLYPFRSYKKWKSGEYKKTDLLFNSFKLSSKWYIFSTTIRHMNYFLIIDFFKSNNFELIFEKKFDDKDKRSLQPWSCIFKKEN